MYKMILGYYIQKQKKNFFSYYIIKLQLKIFDMIIIYLFKITTQIL